MFIVPDGPFAGCIVIGVQSFSALGSMQRAFYRDNEGLTWEPGRFSRFGGGTGSATLSEPTLSLGSGGDQLMTVRVDGINRGLKRYFAISRDGGATFDGFGSLPMGTWPSCQASARYVQPDSTSRFGKTIVSGPTFPNAVARRDFKVMLSYDDMRTFALSYAPFDPRRYVGYSSLAMLDDDTVVLGYEAGTAPNHDESVGIAVFNLAQIFKEGVRY
jgi:hypothetical protein